MPKCPAKNCSAAIGTDQVACRTHWFKIPKPLRDQIWQLFRTKPGSDQHRNAVFAAIEFLNQESP